MEGRTPIDEREPLHLGPTAAEQKHLDAGAARRSEAESLVRGTEVLLRKFATLPNVPLDLLDRMERAITAAHASNLLRVDGFSAAQLMATEGDEQ